MMIDETAFKKLVQFGGANLMYASDAPFLNSLEVLATVEPRQFNFEADTPRSIRSKVRYLAGLFPNVEGYALTDLIHGILGNVHLSVSDIGLILDGFSLNNPAKKTSEVPLDRIQTVGFMLQGGATHAATAQEAGVCLETVAAIDDYLGFSVRHEERLMDLTAMAIREGWSVRFLASEAGISKSSAHRYLRKAREVLREIGEIIV